MGTEPAGQDPFPDWMTGAMTSPLEASLVSSLEYVVAGLFAGLPGLAGESRAVGGPWESQQSCGGGGLAAGLGGLVFPRP